MQLRKHVRTVACRIGLHDFNAKVDPSEYGGVWQREHCGDYHHDGRVYHEHPLRQPATAET